MTRPPATLLRGLGLLVLGAGIALAAEHWVLPLLHPHADETDAKGSESGGAGAEEAKAVALVRTVGVERAPMHTRVHGFGVVAPKPSTTSSVSWPVELVVRKIFVVPGYAVASGAPLCEVQPSPDATLQMTLAKQAVESTRAAVETAQARLGLNLGTRLDLQTAEAAASEAQARLQRLTTAPLPADGIIRADFAGVVQAVRAQVGAIIPAGAPSSNSLRPPAWSHRSVLSRRWRPRSPSARTCTPRRSRTDRGPGTRARCRA